MGGSGGGGGSGKADWPDYMKVQHETWLTAVAAQILIDKVGAANPYTGITAISPDAAITAMTTAIGNVLTEVAAPSDPGFGTMTGGFVASVSADIDSYVIDEEYITTQTEKMTKSLKAQRAQTLAMFGSGMRDINAVLTTNFIHGEYALTAEIVREVGRYEGQLRADLAKARVASITTLVASGLDLYKGWLDVFRAAAVTAVDIQRLNIAAQVEELEWQTKFDIAERLWFYDLYQLGGNVLSSIGGGHSAGSVGKPPSKEQSALGGAIAGASIGASVSGPYAGIGAIVGAVVGGVYGYATG